jgi:hypothetical protein
MHLTEGWLIFLVAFLILGGIAWGMLSLEQRLMPGSHGLTPAPAGAPIHADADDDTQETDDA